MAIIETGVLKRLEICASTLLAKFKAIFWTLPTESGCRSWDNGEVGVGQPDTTFDGVVVDGRDDDDSGIVWDKGEGKLLCTSVETEVELFGGSFCSGAVAVPARDKKFISSCVRLSLCSVSAASPATASSGISSDVDGDDGLPFCWLLL